LIGEILIIFCRAEAKAGTVARSDLTDDADDDIDKELQDLMDDEEGLAFSNLFSSVTPSQARAAEMVRSSILYM
jgi:hypothetical protein